MLDPISIRPPSGFVRIPRDLATLLPGDLVNTRTSRFAWKRKKERERGERKESPRAIATWLIPFRAVFLSRRERVAVPRVTPLRATKRKKERKKKKETVNGCGKWMVTSRKHLRTFATSVSRHASFSIPFMLFFSFFQWLFRYFIWGESNSELFMIRECSRIIICDIINTSVSLSFVKLWNPCVYHIKSLEFWTVPMSENEIDRKNCE